ncbi:MAG: response regulator [Candidatus Omnitrophota bacterium]|nr:response regulator [Candidatus Omnitrophota bacterium]
MIEKKGQKILLVDDDRDMCESLADVLTLDSNYNVSFTTSPLKALEMVKTDDFSLVILDYKMPDMNGVELLKHIKEIRPDLIVFMLTAFISNELIEQAKKVGADRVLSKFIWPKEILKYIKKVIG